jgi:hypothetical protein
MTSNNKIGREKNTVKVWGHGVVYMVEARCYKLEGHGLGYQLGEWIIFNLPKPSGCTRPWDLLSL